MGEYTKYGLSIWHWEDLMSLVDSEGRPDYAARNLWNALYTSGQAKRLCPGLWHGDMYAMASAAKMTPEHVRVALDALIKARLVEFDYRYSVLRLTKLPDAGERPSSWKALKGMWNGFITVPPCPVRDRYVSLMRWLVEQAPTEKGVPPDVQTMWTQTFGTIRPPDEATSSYTLTDSDTGTRHQRSLFGSDPIPSQASSLPSSRNQELDSLSIGQGEGRGEGEEREEDLVREREREEEARREVGALGLRLGGAEAGPPDVKKASPSLAEGTNPGTHSLAGDALSFAVSVPTPAVADHATERQNALREVLAAQGMTHLLVPPRKPPGSVPASPADPPRSGDDEDTPTGQSGVN